MGCPDWQSRGKAMGQMAELKVKNSDWRVGGRQWRAAI